MRPPQVLPLIVGLSLCGAGAALLYVWYKTKDNDDETNNDLSAGKSTSVQPNKEKKVECIIPNEIIPVILGRNGVNIKRIEDKTGTIITFREKDKLNQICEIFGQLENVECAVELINQEMARPQNLKEEMSVPKSACNKIVGRCGETLQEICRKSGAKVHITSGGDNISSGGGGGAGAANDKRVNKIVIVGTRSQINMAKFYIQEKIQLDIDLQKQIELNEIKREPRNFKSPTTGLTPASSQEKLPITSNKINDIDNDVPTTSSSSTSPLPKIERFNTSGNSGQLDIYVSAIATPSKFWVQLIGPQLTKLDELVEQMTNYYNIDANQELHKIADPYLGQIVAAIFKYDGKWYRAEIVGIMPNDYNPRDVVLDLYFVDYGDSEYVQPHEVFQLRTDFLTLRFQAIECFLANVKPAIQLDSNTWDQDAIARFEDLTHVAKWRKIIARVMTTKERNKADGHGRREGSPSPVPGVSLYDTFEGQQNNIGEQLIAEGHALPCETPSIYASNSSLSSNSTANSEVLRLDGGSNNTNNLNNNENINHTNNNIETPASASSSTIPSSDSPSSLHNIINGNNDKYDNGNTSSNNNSNADPDEYIDSTSRSINAKHHLLTKRLHNVNERENGEIMKKQRKSKTPTTPPSTPKSPSPPPSPATATTPTTRMPFLNGNGNVNGNNYNDQQKQHSAAIIDNSTNENYENVKNELALSSSSSSAVTITTTTVTAPTNSSSLSAQSSSSNGFSNTKNSANKNHWQTKSNNNNNNNNNKNRVRNTKN